jgi:hypothetical protein
MRQDVFRVAYDEAKAELLAITTKFEELRQRKESLEGVVTVLGPILGVETPSPVAAGSAEANSFTQPAPSEQPNYQFNQVSAPLPEPDEDISDPFQRRVRNALKSSSNNGQGNHGLQPAV